MIYQTNARNAALNAIIALLNGGGKLVFENAANAAVATCNLTNPTAFGAAANGVSIANAIADDTNAVGGTIDHAMLKTSAGVNVVQLSVSLTGGGAEVEVEKLTLRAGDLMRVDSLTLTQSA